MPETMIERVARAARITIKQARAAIEAMKGPSVDMCAAALDPRLGGPAPTFDAMIDAMLSEHSGRDRG